MSTVKIFLADEDAEMPTRAYPNDVGYDLYSTEEIEIPHGCCVTVKTGMHLVMPAGLYAQVHTRSSYGKRGLYVHNGVIDSDYTGEVSVHVMNLAGSVDENGVIHKESYIIQKGDKIAQLLFHSAERPALVETKQLPQTDRGDKGHGSTGR